MAITRSFGGQTLLKPGAYSVSRVDNAQGLAVGDNDTVMLIGEASDGLDGGTENSRVFTTSQIQGLVDFYVSGDIVDAALAASRPSITPGISGPTNYVVYKTNAGVAAVQQATLAGTAGAGAFDVLITFPINASGTTFTQTINIVTLAVDFTSIAADAAVALNADPNFASLFIASSDSANLIVTSLKPGPQFGISSNSDGYVSISIANSTAGITAVTFDEITPGAANLGSTTTSQLAASFTDAFNFDSNVIVPLWSNSAVPGIAAINTLTLGAGGVYGNVAHDIMVDITNGNGVIAQQTLNVQGDSSTTYAASFVTAFNSNSVLSAIYTASSAADVITLTADTVGSAFDISSFVITDTTDTLASQILAIPTPGVNANIQPANRPNAGTEFTNITYPVAAAQLQSHLIERSSVTVRKEAQGIIGANDVDWLTSIGTLDAASINSFLVQACIQDVRVIDSLGALTWKGPHVMAAILAGVRLGSTVGEPLTFKFINANGVGHNINALTGLPIAAVTQFRPGFDFNQAIDNGLTFTELASGGNRIVVDNTRYAIDESFVFNRGSVIEAAQFVARTSRDVLEAIFVGQKVSNGAAESLKNVLRNYLISLNADNIITSSSDAPFGFVEDTFTVSITGNTAEIQVEVKPVQGLDFIFINFTLGNITQSA